MALCATFNASGNLVASPVPDLATCAGYVLLSPQDYQTLSAANATLITSSAEAETIAGAFILLLAIGFVYRTLIRAFSTSYEGNPNEQH